MTSDPRPVFLVGFMGCGKSAAGRRLAELTDREFLDTDLLISQREGKPVDAIFAEAGEGRFRTVEAELLRNLAGRTGVVVATGGGLFLDPTNRRRLKRQGMSVWLDASIEVVRERIGNEAGRPLWVPGDPVAQRVRFDRRRAAYALADLRVDASSGDPDEVARRVLKRLIRISG